MFYIYLIIPEINKLKNDYTEYTEYAPIKRFFINLSVYTSQLMDMTVDTASYMIYYVYTYIIYSIAGSLTSVHEYKTNG